MASSFSTQIPGILYLIQQLNPKSVLDIGKGFGKYGFLIHEYVGISNRNRVNPELPMKDQSTVSIDAVEVDVDLMLPHLKYFYNNIYQGDVLEIYPTFKKYDLVLMIDIIEHIEKEKSLEMLAQFLKNGSKVLIATPKEFFEQKNLYDSEYESHVSHWTRKDFEKLGFVEDQRYEAGIVYLLSKEKVDIRGFGNSMIKKLRRVARMLKSEL